jgi:predicted lipoprotein with Yx(FWY)xxD motif
VNFTSKRLHHLPGRKVLLSALALGAAATVAACSSSSSSGSAASPSTAASSPATSPATSPASASASAPASASSTAATVSVKSVPGVGAVLVNGQGRTLYMLTSEKGGKITCTAANGCTGVWPETTLATGTTATAGSGVQPSLLGTVKDASGNLEVTYNHWPLYTFSGDSGVGVAHGEGITSFGGTWYVLNAAGNPVTSSQGASSSPSSGGNGY